jgi:hypothetical protein
MGCLDGENKGKRGSNKHVKRFVGKLDRSVKNGWEEALKRPLLFCPFLDGK